MSSRVYHATVEGRIVPKVRVTQRSKYVGGRWSRYTVSRDAIRWSIRQQCPDLVRRPIEGAYEVEVVVAFAPTRAGALPRNAGDLDNIIGTVLDALQGYVTPDDSWCVALRARKVLGTADMVMISINEMTNTEVPDGT